MKWVVMAFAAGLCLAQGSDGWAQAKDGAQPLSVARMVSSIQEGQQWARLRRDRLCLFAEESLAWGIGAGRLNLTAFLTPIRTELKKEGYTVAGDDTDPFNQKKEANLAVGGTITALHGDFCGGPLSGFRGSASISVDWAVYSTVERRILMTMHADGSAKSDEIRPGGLETVLIDAMDDSLRKITASDQFKQLVSADEPSPKSAIASTDKTPQPLLGSRAAQPVKISDAVGAVVLLLSGGGHGSGVLVSSDGYLLTAQHVVGDDKYVKVRWSDGLEGVGEVIRSDKRRDVAVIKTDPRGRSPLPLHAQAPQPGDTVFAIGAPLDVTLQSTVTRGVVSANRIMDGFAFIQSDVTVNPGNSGGPLLSEKGEVLGITDLSLRERGDTPTGLNFFVPVADALAFLSLEPR